MAEPAPRRGRTHDAEGAREAILNAAEEIFAEHGFDGARIDVIAAASGYNKSLIFQYFGDKLELYARVIRRIDERSNGLMAQALAAISDDETAFNANKFRAFLEDFLRAYFDFLIENPRVTRILMWEMAEGWQTYNKIATPKDKEDLEKFKPFFEKVYKAGLLRSDFDPIAQFVFVEFFYPCYLAWLPLYQMLRPEIDASSPEALARARDYIIDFVIQGMLADVPEGARKAEK